MGPTEPGAEGATLDRWWTGFGDPALTAAIVEGLAHNYDLQAAVARLDAAAAQATIAGADLVPTVSGGLSGARNRVNFIGLPIPGAAGGVLSSTTSSYGVSLDLSWELDLWGRVRSGHSAALADFEASAADLAAARLSLVGQVSKAWFATVEAREQLDLAVATVESYTATLADVEQLYARGTRDAFDVRLARLNLASAEANRDARREQQERARRQLELLLGRYPAGAMAPGRAFPDTYAAVPAGIPSAVLRRRPDLRAAERRLAASGARVDEAVAALFPRLSLTASGGTSSDSLADVLDTDLRVWSLAGNLLAPLFEGGRLRAAVQLSEAQLREATADYSGAVLRALSEVETSLAVERHLALQEASRRAAAEHAVEALSLAQDRYDRGIADFLSVADSQRQALAQRSQLLTVQRQRLEARIDLFLALGGGFAVPDADSASAEQQP